MQSFGAQPTKPPPALTFVVNNVAFFVSHRLPLAQKAIERGWTVRLYTGHAGNQAQEAQAMAAIQKAGVPHTRMAFRSGGMNPLVELTGLLQLAWHMRRHRPNIVHCASPKGQMYGGMAARLTGVRSLVLAVSGMGFAFTQGASDGARGGTTRRIAARLSRLLTALAFAHKHKRVIAQNRDDLHNLEALGLARPDELALIQGSGVALDRFVNAPIDTKEPIVLLPARMLRDKGVLEFVDAARSLRARGHAWRFVLAGGADHDNPSALSAVEVKAWVQRGHVEWLGHVEDIAPWMARASIVCLPSYREGMPKALLEAAAAGCAVVTTDAIGCREAVEPNVTGDVVPVGDAKALAAALERLMVDGDQRRRFAQAGRARAVAMFSIDAVVRDTFKLYDTLLAAVNT
jgi:glycosyltransferase involved in cell wall biosynthesis